MYYPPMTGLPKLTRITNIEPFNESDRSVIRLALQRHDMVTQHDLGHINLICM